jgi:hypothetical protein
MSDRELMLEAALGLLVCQIKAARSQEVINETTDRCERILLNGNRDILYHAKRNLDLAIRIK